MKQKGLAMDKQMKKKKTLSWKSYGMEFLMVFAAITLGFFADNQREKWGETARGVQYAQRLVEDLDLDSIRMEEVKVNYALKEQQINTLIPLMQEGLEKGPFLDSLFAYFTLPGSGSLVTSAFYFLVINYVVLPSQDPSSTVVLPKQIQLKQSTSEGAAMGFFDGVNEG